MRPIRKSIATFISVLLVLFVLSPVAGQQVAALTADQKAKVQAWLDKLSPLGSDPIVVAALRTYNEKHPEELAGMTQAKWAELAITSPEIRFIAGNDLAKYLKTKRDPVMAELFVSGADGTKVAFFGKTTSWSHAGKPKHDLPMSGKTWIGDPALDESSGKYSVQVAFPVLDGKKPIGSIVVGLDLSKL